MPTSTIWSATRSSIPVPLVNNMKTMSLCLAARSNRRGYIKGSPPDITIQ